MKCGAFDKCAADILEDRYLIYLFRVLSSCVKLDVILSSDIEGLRQILLKRLRQPGSMKRGTCCRIDTARLPIAV